MSSTDNHTVISALQLRWMERPPQCNHCSPEFDPATIHTDHIRPRIEAYLALLDEAGRLGSDLAVTSEDMTGIYSYMYALDRPGLFPELAETVPGPVTEELGAAARLHGMYVVACFFERDQDRLYNTAAIIGRDGQLLGKYRKVQLPAPETWWCTHGDRLPLFELDFGKIGVAICYDIVFPEVTACYALDGMDLLVHPTAGYGRTEDLGESTLKVRAHDHSVHIVVAKEADGRHSGRSGIFSFDGQLLADGGYLTDVVVSARIDFTRGREEPDSSFAAAITGVRDVRARYALERRPGLYRRIGVEKPPLLKRYGGKELLHRRSRAEIESVARELNTMWRHDAEFKDRRYS